MSRFLVTGGCGFIGSHLVDALMAAGHQVRVLDDLSTGRRDHLPAGVELMVGDVADPGMVERATAGIEGCFHLAAIASVQRCNEDWQGAHRVNLGGQINLLDAARTGDFPVVYASSAAVYGDTAEGPVAEATLCRPRSAYGADKLGCELHAAAGATVHGLRSLGLRFFNVYGPRQRADNPYSGVISIFADRIATGGRLIVHGDGRQVRDFVFVADVVAALERAMGWLLAQDGPAAEIANVCTGHGTPVIELARTLMALAGRRTTIEHGPAREGDIRHSVGDEGKALALLGFAARTSLRDGLRPTYEALSAATDGRRAGPSSSRLANSEA